MSDAYERERQNNTRLSELSAKVSALRGVTVDIYDNARQQDVIDNTVRIPVYISRAAQRIQANCGIVRYLLINAHKPERIRKQTRTYGSKWEQSCDIQVKRDDHRRCTGVMVYLGLDFLKRRLDGRLASRHRSSAPFERRT